QHIPELTILPVRPIAEAIEAWKCIVCHRAVSVVRDKRLLAIQESFWHFTNERAYSDPGTHIAQAVDRDINQEPVLGDDSKMATPQVRFRNGPSVRVVTYACPLKSFILWIYFHTYAQRFGRVSKLG